MIGFELVSENRGWESSAIPDDLKMNVRTDAGWRTINASLDELLRAYGHIRNRENGTVPVYTSRIEFRFDEDTCHHTLLSVKEDVPIQELSRAVSGGFSSRSVRGADGRRNVENNQGGDVRRGFP